MLFSRLTAFLFLFCATISCVQSTHASCNKVFNIPRAAGLPTSAERPFIQMHDLAKSFFKSDSKLFDGVELTMGGNEPRRGYSQSVQSVNRLFTRDYEPLQTRLSNNRLAMITYINAKFSDSAVVGLGPIVSSGPRNGPAEIPNATLYRIHQKPIWMEQRHLPLYVEGSSFVRARDFLLVSEKVLFENARSHDEIFSLLAGNTKSEDMKIHIRHLIHRIFEAGYKPRSRDEVLSEIAKAFEIDPSRILFLPWMPGERTGHLDMYAADLPDGRVAIPQIPEYIIHALGFGHEQSFAHGLNDFLSAQARTLESNGVSVVRIPMLSPRELIKSHLSSLGWDAQFPSTVNWILAGNTVRIPQFNQILKDLPLEIQERFKSELHNQLIALGLEPIYVEASELLYLNGLLHCISNQYATH